MADPDYNTVKKLKIRAHKGGKLNFAERNIINIYDKKIAKQGKGPIT